jgi:hypothetical protein
MSRALECCAKLGQVGYAADPVRTLVNPAAQPGGTAGLGEGVDAVEAEGRRPGEAATHRLRLGRDHGGADGRVGQSDIDERVVQQTRGGLRVGAVWYDEQFDVHVDIIRHLVRPLACVTQDRRRRKANAIT